MKRRDGVTRGFLDNDGTKFRVCVWVKGLKKERLAGARVIVSVGEEGNTNSTSTQEGQRTEWYCKDGGKVWGGNLSSLWN